MYDEIMNRPMFQTPQQRQGAGIMAGVAPVRGYADGDLVSDDFFSIEQTEEGSGMNLRDLTDLFCNDWAYSFSSRIHCRSTSKDGS
jgi:hypothetical protein